MAKSKKSAKKAKKAFESLTMEEKAEIIIESLTQPVAKLLDDFGQSLKQMIEEAVSVVEKTMQTAEAEMKNEETTVGAENAPTPEPEVEKTVSAPTKTAKKTKKETPANPTETTSVAETAPKVTKPKRASSTKTPPKPSAEA